MPLYGVHAGVASFVNGLIDGSASRASAQGMGRTFPHEATSMLAAATNSDPNPTKSTSDLTIEDDALVPSITPEGIVFVEGIVSATGKPGPTQIARYIVHKGDTLGAVAKMFGVSVNTIRWANDLSGQSIKVGQELLILPVTGVQYTVKKGDTLASIAKKFKGDQKEIISYNGLSGATDLSVGEKLIIPDGVEAAAIVPNSAGTSSYIQGFSGPDIAGYYARPLPASCPRTQGLHGHNGKDIGCPIGTDILASAPGEITIARGSGYNGGFGHFVVISHPNGTQTVYAHMSEVGVSPGQYVTRGQKIGEVGNTGKSTGPHLHFEVRGAKNPF